MILNKYFLEKKTSLLSHSSPPNNTPTLIQHTLRITPHSSWYNQNHTSPDCTLHFNSSTRIAFPCSPGTALRCDALDTQQSGDMTD